jgi:exosortase
LDGKSIVLAVGIAALLVLAFAPTLAWLAEAWASDAYYSHGPLVVLISAFLVWQARRVVRAEIGHSSLAGIPLLAVGLAVHGVAVLWRAYFLSAFGLLAVLAGLALYFLGRGALRVLLFPIAFLAFAIPLPLAERFGPPLEVFTATVATGIVRTLGIPAVSEGSRVLLAGSTFAVGAPCSGLRSLVALMALTALFCYLVKGSKWARGLLFLTAIPVAVAANLVRVASLFGVAYAFGTEAGLGYYHDLSSPVLFLVAFLMLMVLSRGLRCGDLDLARFS